MHSCRERERERERTSVRHPRDDLIAVGGGPASSAPEPGRRRPVPGQDRSTQSTPLSAFPTCPLRIAHRSGPDSAAQGFDHYCSAKLRTGLVIRASEGVDIAWRVGYGDDLWPISTNIEHPALKAKRAVLRAVRHIGQTQNFAPSAATG
jgi:hypothetical protein